MRYLKIKGLKTLSKSTQKSIGGGAINIPIPIIFLCDKVVCEVISDFPITLRCRWVPMPC